MKSKCLILKNRELRIEKMEIEKLRELYKIPKKFVVVKSLYTGICGSDFHKIRLGTKNEVILGHECVVEYNKKSYVLNPLLPCQKCEMCKKGHENLCEKIKTIGFNFPGGFSEYFFVPPENLYKIKDPSPLYVLVDAFTSVYHGLKNIKQLLEDNGIEEVLIIGDGVIGFFSALLLSTHLHFRKIQVIGKHRKRLRIFEEVMNNVETILLKNGLNFRDSKFSFIIEAVGGEKVDPLLYAISQANPRSIILSYGVFDPNKLYKVPLRNIFEKEIVLTGSKSYTSKEFKESLRLFNLYRDKLDSLKSYLKIDKLENIYHLLNRNNDSWKENYLKLIIDWSEKYV